MKLSQLFYIWRREKFLRKTIGGAEFLLRNHDVNKEEQSPSKYVVLHFHVKGIKLARGILMLCNAGLMSDAKILLRSLFEVALYCEYILIDPNDVKAIENIFAVAAFEDKNTEEELRRLGGVDVDKMAINQTDKDFLKGRVQQKTQIVNVNYDFSVERLRQRSRKYANLSANEIFNREGVRDRSFLTAVNQKYNKETVVENLWKKYKNILRDCSKSIHGLDFEMNVKSKNEGLAFEFKERKETGAVILSATTTFLIRIMDVTNEIFNFKADDAVKKLFDTANNFSLKK